MSIADLVGSLLGGGTASLVALTLVPVIVGLASWGLARAGRIRTSQLVANAGIAVGAVAVLTMICALIWGNHHGISMVEDVDVLWLLVPFYLVVAGFFVEHWVHPGRQEAIRAQIRGVVLIVIVLAVLYWLLTTMRIWMLVHTSVFGLVLFVVALVGILYYLVRKML